MEPASSAPRCAAAQRPDSIQVPTSDAPSPSSRGDDPQGDTAAHAGGARARGRAAGLLQVAAIAAVSVLLTLLVAGNVQVSVQFGDTTRPPPAAAPPLRSLELSPDQSLSREPGPSALPPPAPFSDSSREPALIDSTLPWLLRGIWKETPDDIIWKRVDRDAPAIRPVRPGLKFTWESHRNQVETAGHHWCNLMRDKWSCFGPKYAEVLKRTPAFDRSFALSQLPNGTNVLVHGHSHVALGVTTLICQSMVANEVKVYKISAGTDKGILEGNSLIAYLPTNNVSLLLLSNEYDQWDKIENFPKLLRFLALWKFYPRVVLLGHVNGDKGKKSGSRRTSQIQQQFPEAITRRLNSADLITKECLHPACGSRPPHGHSCTPGPILRRAEWLGETLLHDAQQHPTGPVGTLRRKRVSPARICICICMHKHAPTRAHTHAHTHSRTHITH